MAHISFRQCLQSYGRSHGRSHGPRLICTNGRPNPILNLKQVNYRMNLILNSVKSVKLHSTYRYCLTTLLVNLIYTKVFFGFSNDWPINKIKPHKNPHWREKKRTINSSGIEI